MGSDFATIHGKPHLPLETITSCVEFGEAYGSYVDVRNQLQEAEWRGGSSPADLLQRTVDSRESVAHAVLHLYDESDSLGEFDEKVEAMLDADETAQLEAKQSGHDNPKLAAYLARVSLLDVKTPSPVEAIVTSKQNLGIASQFAGLAAQHATGMLMSGANAWGAFYEVKGDKPDHPFAENAVWRPDEASDIDLLMTVANTTDLKSVVNDLCDAEVVSPFERRRVAKYNQLYQRGEVDIFSLRAYFQGIEQSIHFLTDDYVDSIVELHPEGATAVTDNGHAIHIARDFRPNFPNSIRKTGGYTLTDLKGLRADNFIPELSEVSDCHGESLGYISQNTVGSVYEQNGERTYAMGVISFFLGIHPVILADRQTGLEQKISRFQSNIAEVMDGQAPAYVTRQERMPGYTLRRVQKDLSLIRNAS